MGALMSSHERFRRVYAHQEPDRVPFQDYAWGATLARWRNEGLPDGADLYSYFDLDVVPGIGADNSPRYPEEVLEETDEYRIITTCWGMKQKVWKTMAGTPEHLSERIVDPQSWAEAKARMTPTPDRINWQRLKENYPKWKERDLWIQGNLWFGFDITHSHIVGTERLLMAMVERPEWCVDMFNHQLDVGLALLEQVLEAGYTFDVVHWPDDMGYKQNQFFSIGMYRELLKPVQKRAVEWAHARGIKVHLHSCGDIRPLVPELVEIGIDALNPMEVKAGMDPLDIKRRFGRELVLHGGLNVVLWDDLEAVEAEMRRIMPELKAGGGYIFASDHSIPSSVSLPTFRRIVELYKELGSYD